MSYQARMIAAKEQGDLEAAAKISWKSFDSDSNFYYCAEFLAWAFRDSGDVEGMQLLTNRLLRHPRVATGGEGIKKLLCECTSDAAKVNALMQRVAQEPGITLSRLRLEWGVDNRPEIEIDLELKKRKKDRGEWLWPRLETSTARSGVQSESVPFVWVMTGNFG